MSAGFEDRMGWSLDMQKRHAISIYKNHWDLKRVIEVDELGDAGDAQMQALDYSGIDKILITTNGYPIHIAQRFRQPYYDEELGWTDADFSLRVSSYQKDYVEYQKLLDAHTGAGSTPSVYGFGRTPQGRQPAREEGFKQFFLIDLPEFLRKHISGEIDVVEQAPNGDGSMGAYFDIDDLRDVGCLIAEFDFTSKTDSKTALGL